MREKQSIRVNIDEENFKVVRFGKIKNIPQLPHLIEVQLNSYKEFLQQGVPPHKRQNIGLQSVFEETFPIESSNGDVILEFVEYSLGEPKKSIWECKIHGLTYAVPLKAVIRLIAVETGEVREQEVYMGDLPIMTPTGTFIINGTERVVVNQLQRSPGVFIFHEEAKNLFTARIIPDHKGSWLEFEVDPKGLLIARIDRRKKFPVTLLIKALGYNSNEEVLRLFFQSEKVPIKGSSGKTLQKYIGRRVIADVLHPETGEILLEAGGPLNEDNLDIIRDAKVEQIELIINPGMVEDTLILRSLEKDGVANSEEALIEFLKIQKPLEYSADHGDPEKRQRNIDRAKAELNRLFFDPKTYNMGSVGRYKINAKFRHLNPKDFSDDVTEKTLRPIDIIETVKYMVYAINEVDGYHFDDIDHLGNRRVRTVGELLTMQLKTGFARMERVVKERMSMNDVDVMTPQLLISIKPIAAVLNEFFGSSQLSQFMDQTNPLSEITHKRRLNALGPGGLTRERAGFEVRDVHYTHYGRLCPIETPEGPNIGLIASLATYARLNPYGFVETPYRVVKNGKVTGEIKYLSANEEDHYVIAQANANLDENGAFLDKLVSCRHRGDFPLKSPEEIDLMDVAPSQVISLSTSLIPFLEHDDANRALMGSNMQRQAVPLIETEVPRVGTGMEYPIAYDSGVLVIAEHDGVVVKVDADHIEVRRDNGTIDSYPLVKFKRTNQSTTMNQVPIVSVHQAPEDGVVEKIDKEQLIFVGDSGTRYVFGLTTFQLGMKVFVKSGGRVRRGELLAGEIVRGRKGQDSERKATILADGMATKNGRLALGKNITVAFMPLDGYNFEDAIILSQRLVKEDVFTSIHIEEFEIQARETKLGREMITRDIPNISERAFRDLDEDGIIRIGAEVRAGDILVGMVTPKGETDLTPEYRLLHSIFGEKAKDVKDNSLRVPNGYGGIVVDVIRFSRDNGDELPAGIVEAVKVYVAQKRKIQVGDKMAGRHGNKGVISVILPEEDMPFLPDGTPVDIVLNPLGVPSRMNLGQVFETQLGYIGKALGLHFETPVFDGAKWEDIARLAKEAGIDENSKIRLRDGRTGEYFIQPAFVGTIYMMKLHHMVEDKMHARSTGPYSLVTQQPLGGKAQFGGQRLGEMEVWALEAYGAAHTLQELLTVKSDDMQGRARVYESIVKGIHAIKPGIPESFNVLVREMRSLALDVTITDATGQVVELSELEDDMGRMRRRIKIDSVENK
ncbi:MAG: DNA-directed RNA polymerase subunit beta [Leptospiraceae bacterium]|nr:DNA-directed RNA polymerase subunit beta [Leptospiraceae bacterium]MDW8305578.1 DNA-directed RNA polymerase subunit beta [Leptospiraceae bacterium]